MITIIILLTLLYRCEIKSYAMFSLLRHTKKKDKKKEQNVLTGFIIIVYEIGPFSELKLLKRCR